MALIFIKNLSGLFTVPHDGLWQIGVNVDSGSAVVYIAPSGDPADLVCFQLYHLNFFLI